MRYYCRSICFLPILKNRSWNRSTNLLKKNLVILYCAVSLPVHETHGVPTSLKNNESGIFISTDASLKLVALLTGCSISTLTISGAVLCKRPQYFFQQLVSHSIGSFGLLTGSSTASLCSLRQDDPFAAAELLRAVQTMPRPVKNLNQTWSETPLLLILIPEHHLPLSFALLAQDPPCHCFQMGEELIRLSEGLGEEEKIQPLSGSWKFEERGWKWDLRKFRMQNALLFLSWHSFLSPSTENVYTLSLSVSLPAPPNPRISKNWSETLIRTNHLTCFIIDFLGNIKKTIFSGCFWQQQIRIYALALWLVPVAVVRFTCRQWCRLSPAHTAGMEEGLK